MWLKPFVHLNKLTMIILTFNCFDDIRQWWILLLRELLEPLDNYLIRRVPWTIWRLFPSPTGLYPGAPMLSSLLQVIIEAKGLSKTLHRCDPLRLGHRVSTCREDLALQVYQITTVFILSLQLYICALSLKCTKVCISMIESDRSSLL